MGLQDYDKKRDFARSPEPAGTSGKGEQGEELRFVVQKHAASRLHYDFRLELDGVLKSWAVPKGPTLDPSVKRLAMMVEDHPYDYKDFEGVIPKGNYGAGRVIVWDEGTWHSYESDDPAESQKLLRKGLHQGELKFVLHGHKLNGKFALVRTGTGGDKAWLLLKKNDEFAARDAELDGRSVVTGRTIDDEPMPADSAELHKKLAAAPAGPMPRALRPMLATLVKEPFDDPGWLFEIKLDGYRALAETGESGATLYSRNNLPFNRQFPQVVAALEKVGREALFDGELVIYDEKGRSHFQLLQNYQRTGAGQIIYCVFDLLYLEGKDLRTLPLVARKELLREVLPDLPQLRYVDHVPEEGRAFFELARDNGLEGIIAKRGESRYMAGRRSRDWLKIKTQLRQEAVICGFTAPRGSRKRFGALILGAWDQGELVYIGHSGGGFDEQSLREIHERLLPLVTPDCPFRQEPKTNMPVRWVKPMLVCEVAFSEWTDERVMRQPVFLGMREDKEADSVVRETGWEEPPQEGAPTAGKREAQQRVVIGGRELKLTNLDKVFWQAEGYTKGDVVDYYQSVATFILPYLKDRPQSLYRTPHGIHGDGFYQKDVGELPPEWIRTEEIFSESNRKNITYLICQDEATLVYLANLGCIEINPWLSRVQQPDHPDYLVIDLDPEDIPFAKVIDAALAVREVLRRAGATGYPKTSGATGIHIYVPLEARYSYDTATTFARLIATLAHGLVPEFTSLERSPSKRQKKVYLDFLQNRRGQTLAAPYSIRPRPGAPISTPLTWDEVGPGLDPGEFTIRTILRRLEKVGDLYRGVLGTGVDLLKCVEQLEKV